MDAIWLRTADPVDLFNKFEIIDGRSIDFDTTLDFQYRKSKAEERTVVQMSLDELIHPSQMICQYTMFRRYPARLLPCFSIPMIPFFDYLSNTGKSLTGPTGVLENGHLSDLDLLGDGTRINLSMLNVAHVDWLLKQIAQACCALSIPPDHKSIDTAKLSIE